MPHVITKPCIGRKDGACAAICPCECIHPKRAEAGFDTAAQLYVNPDGCIDCALCVDECPVNAIYQDEAVPAKWRQYVKMNADHYATA